MEKNQNKALSNDQLKNAVDQLQQQNRFLAEQLSKRHHEEMYKRIEYLFEVVKNPSIFIEIDKEFVKSCVVELISILSLQEDKGQQEDQPVEQPSE